MDGYLIIGRSGRGDVALRMTPTLAQAQAFADGATRPGLSASAAGDVGRALCVVAVEFVAGVPGQTVLLREFGEAD